MKDQEKRKFNEVKILEIKKKIAQGTFLVNPQAIADTLINKVGVEYLLKEKTQMH